MQTGASSTRWVAIVVGIIVILGIVWIFNQKRGEEGQSGPVSGIMLVAEVRSPEGEVELIRGDKELVVENGTALQENDIVRTKEGSVSLEFFAGSRVALDAHTQLRVDTANINKANQRDQRVEVTVLAGRAWGRVLKLLEVDSSFKAHGGKITATVRGTAFALTARPGVAGNDATLDLFDGQLGIEDPVEGILEEGFTLTQGLGNDGQPFGNLIAPTPDETRNNRWIRAQLAADNEFVERVSQTRRDLGDRTDDGEVGEEAGPFTLGTDDHSNYQYLQIRTLASIGTLKPGESMNLAANAYFYEGSAMTERNVTREATWQISDRSLATIDQNGVLTALPGASGTVTIVARWNDGTHEHSNTVDITIGDILVPSR